jgi:hypothetical protein
MRAFVTDGPGSASVHDVPEPREAVCFLASPRAAATTGTLLAVDGGMTSLRLPS